MRAMRTMLWVAIAAIALFAATAEAQLASPFIGNFQVCALNGSGQCAFLGAPASDPCGLARAFFEYDTNDGNARLLGSGKFVDQFRQSTLVEGPNTFKFYWSEFNFGPYRLYLELDGCCGLPTRIVAYTTPNGQPPAGFGDLPTQLTQVIGNKTITLTSVSVTPAAGSGLDNVNFCNLNPGHGPDAVGTFTLNVTTAPPPDAPPTSVPGGPYTIVQDQPVILDGTASHDDNTPSAELGYAWTVTSSPAGSTGGVLTGANTAAPTFTPDVPGTFTLTLTVTDDATHSHSADATVSSTNVAPIASAGAGVGSYVGALVTLDGSGSTDPNGDSFTYAWSLAGPAGSTATLANATSASPSFSPDVAGQYMATLTVTDQWGASAMASTDITVATPGDYAEAQITDAINFVNALPPGSVTGPGQQAVLSGMLRVATAALQREQPVVARVTLALTISRTDGCALRGTPDLSGLGRDWVTDCAAQLQLYNELQASLDAITP